MLHKAPDASPSLCLLPWVGGSGSVKWTDINWICLEMLSMGLHLITMNTVGQWINMSLQFTDALGVTKSFHVIDRFSRKD